MNTFGDYMHILKLKDYAKRYPNPCLKALETGIKQVYDQWGNMADMNAAAKFGLEIAGDRSKPYRMRADGLALAKKVLMKQDTALSNTQ